MRQRIPAILAALGILVVAASASAQRKPATAVLGLEVIDEGTGIDPQTTELAKILTQALRDRARLPNSPYRLAPNSGKDLLELKLLSGCADEARNCMAAIGRDLGAQWLIFGKVEKRDTGYQVTLKLLNVETMAMERVTTELIPFADNNGPALANKWSRALFNRLTGIPEQGNLAVQANVSRGRVFVDGQLATTLRQGRARIDGLAEGKHPVAIEAEGHRRYETTVEIAAGDTVALDAQLEAVAVGPPGGGGGAGGGDAERPGGTSRMLFWTTAVATGLTGSAWLVSGYQYRVKYTKEKENAIAEYQNDGSVLDETDACADAREQDVEAVVDACDQGETWAMRSTIFGITAGVLAAATGYFYYAGYMKPDSGERRSARRSKREPAETTVELLPPTITPDYFGAGVKITF